MHILRSDVYQSALIHAQQPRLTGHFPGNYLRWIAAFLLIISGGRESLRAQTAHFAGVESVVASSGLSNPGQVAADLSGNIFILDTGNSRLLKETPGAGGYQQSVVSTTTMDSPSGLAVDSAGHVFIVDSGNNRILEESPSGSTYTEAVMSISGLSRPTGIAADATGNLYISDTGNSRILKETLIGSNYTQTTVATGITVGAIAVENSGCLWVQNLDHGVIQRMAYNGYIYLPVFTLLGAISSSISIATTFEGIVFINDGGNSHVFREVTSQSGDYASYVQKNVVSMGSTVLAGIAVDGNRNVYFIDSTNNRVLKLAMQGGDFGSVAVGSTGSPISLIFGFDAGASIASSAVVTQGVTGLDFSDAGTGTCTTNGPSHSYLSGDTCTVNVQFKAKGPGARYGAAVLYDSSGNAMATGYVQGNGLGPQVHFPGVKRTFSFSGATHPFEIAADAAGNLYIMDVPSQWTYSNSVYKETWTGSVYVRSTVATNLYDPIQIAVDGAGNVYVASLYLYKYTPNHKGGYTQTSFDLPPTNTYALAADGFGNVYFPSPWVGSGRAIQIDTPEDGTYGHRIFNVDGQIAKLTVGYKGDMYWSTMGSSSIMQGTPSDGSYVQSALLDGGGAESLSLDGMGRLYLAGNYSVKEETYPGSSSLETLVSSVQNGPRALTVDGTGNVYYIVFGASSVTKLDFSQPSTLQFAVTNVGSTSSDSPKTEAIKNTGNAPLTFPIPTSGVNPLLPSGFTMRDTLSTDCPVVSSGASVPGTLAASTSCNLVISYSPQSSSDSSGWMTVTDDNPPGPNYATQSVALVVTGHQIAPSIQWSTPANIVYGTALGAQLSATTNVPGTFVYSPASGTVLTAGSHTLTVTFTPTDTSAFKSASSQVTIVVDKATPKITWPAPAPITYGTALSSTQLTASTPVAGTFSYSPPAGTVLSAGTQTLSVTFTPTDMANYTSPVTATVSLKVNQSVPTITWATPSSVTYGTALGGTQLNATTTVPGAFTYSPSAGTVLAVGSHTLTATFTPTDTTNYKSASASVWLTVTRATPVLSWAAPGPIHSGTALGAGQLNATSNTAGSFSYTPGPGTVLGIGWHVLTVQFTPTDSTNYVSNSTSVNLQVLGATPVITWKPKPLAKGARLGRAQLNATASTPGTFVYRPGAGTALGPGWHTISLVFAPEDGVHFNSASAATVIMVK